MSLGKNSPPLPHLQESLATSLNTQLTDRLNSIGNLETAFPVFQQVFSEVIESVPSFRQVLRRIKEGYEEVVRTGICERASQQVAQLKRQNEDLQDMLELQQQEKHSLLKSIMELKRENATLNGTILHKNTKIAALENRVEELSCVKSADQTRFEDTKKTIHKRKDDSKAVKSSEDQLLSVLNSRLHSITSPQTRPQPFPQSYPVNILRSTPSFSGLSSIDMISPIRAEPEAFVSDQEASRTEVRESIQHFAPEVNHMT